MSPRPLLWHRLWGVEDNLTAIDVLEHFGAGLQQFSQSVFIHGFVSIRSLKARPERAWRTSISLPATDERQCGGTAEYDSSGESHCDGEQEEGFEKDGEAQCHGYLFVFFYRVHKRITQWNPILRSDPSSGCAQAAF